MIIISFQIWMLTTIVTGIIGYLIGKQLPIKQYQHYRGVIWVISVLTVAFSALFPTTPIVNIVQLDESVVRIDLFLGITFALSWFYLVLSTARWSHNS